MPLADFLEQVAFTIGVKQASVPKATNTLAGLLYLAPSGYLLLAVPNALVRGAFSALNQPGAELPPCDDGKFNAHITVMRPDELDSIGGADKVTERGKTFHYGLGRLVEITPHGWPEMAKAWALKAHSPELQKLRRSYGLTSLPNGGKYDFHVTVAVRRKRVLSSDSAVAKGGSPAGANG